MAVQRRLVGTINFSETQSNIITDLTGTTWVGNNSLSIDFGVNTYNINFTSNNVNYTSITLNGVQVNIRYNSTTVYDDFNNWTNNEYKTIQITGGTDATNSNLISWLQANATQVEIIDLSNTEWLLSDTITYAGLPDNPQEEWYYSINFTSNNTNYTSFNLETGGNMTLDLYYNSTTVRYFDTWTNNVYKTFSITSGTDVTNPDLIVWLTNNATLQAVPVISYTITPTFTHITSSNTTYTIDENDTWTTTLSADINYTLPSTITVVGATSNYNSTTGVLTLSNPTGNVTITATGVVQRQHNTVLCVKKAVQSTVTDLTGTTWLLNDTWTTLPNGADVSLADGDTTPYDLNFTSNSNNYDYFRLYDRDYSHYLSYDKIEGGDEIYTGIVDYSWNWTNNAYKTITITGSPSSTVTNSQLISWLYNNATLISGASTSYQLVPVSVVQKTAESLGGIGGTVTDLTGTKWILNSTISYDSSFPTSSLPYSLTYKAYYNNSSNYNTGTDLYMSYQSMPIPGDVPTSNDYYGLCGNGLNNFSGIFFGSCIYEGYNTTTMTPTSNGSATIDYIEITGGNDVTNSDLISWLENNASLQTGTLNPIYLTYTSKAYSVTTNITNGTYTGPSLVFTGSDSKIILSANTGYTLPSTITVTGASYTYDSTTGEINLSNFTNDITITVTCVASGYSGNILASAIPAAAYSGNVFIKFGTAPQNLNDYDALLPSSSSVLQGNSSYTNQTVAYIWTELSAVSATFNYNNQTVSLSDYYANSYTGTINPYELQLTGNYDITLIVRQNLGGSND